MSVNDLIVFQYKAAKFLFHRMIDDLTPEEFHHQPVPGANSTCWIVGHLALVLRRTLDRLGVKDGPPMPEDLPAQYGQTKQSAGDQSKLGDPKALVAFFDGCIDKMIEIIPTLTAADLDQPSTFPMPLATKQCEAISFGSFHIVVHTGQISTIRRSLGKPPVV